MHAEPSSVSHGKAEFIFLESQFDAWFRILSPSFHPGGKFLSGQDSEAIPSGYFDRELWFSNDLCSTTIMYYHIARMLLLIHRPSDLLFEATSNSRGTSIDLLRMFRDVEERL